MRWPLREIIANTSEKSLYVMMLIPPRCKFVTCNMLDDDCKVQSKRLYVHSLFLTCSGCYLGVYAGLGGIQSIFTLVSAVSLAAAGVLASKTLHAKLLKNILRCPMSFFDTTPLGRILNRFSLDIYIIDNAIPSTVQLFLYRVLSTFGVFLVVSVATPIFITVIIPLGLFFYMIQVRKQIILSY